MLIMFQIQNISHFRHRIILVHKSNCIDLSCKFIEMRLVNCLWRICYVHILFWSIIRWFSLRRIFCTDSLLSIVITLTWLFFRDPFQFARRFLGSTTTWFFFSTSFFWFFFAFFFAITTWRIPMTSISAFGPTFRLTTFFLFACRFTYFAGLRRARMSSAVSISSIVTTIMRSWPGLTPFSLQIEKFIFFLKKKNNFGYAQS